INQPLINYHQRLVAIKHLKDIVQLFTKNICSEHFGSLLINLLQGVGLDSGHVGTIQFAIINLGKFLSEIPATWRPTAGNFKKLKLWMLPDQLTQMFINHLMALRACGTHTATHRAFGPYFEWM